MSFHWKLISITFPHVRGRLSHDIGLALNIAGTIPST